MNKLVFRPLTPARWAQYEGLVGPNGASSGCWCMWWRLPNHAYRGGQGAVNKRHFKALVKKGPPPGLLALENGEAVGWCAVCPRKALPALDRSRQLARVDDVPVWSASCFFIKRSARGKGLSGALVEAALDYARDKGAPALEAYPWDVKVMRAPTAIYTGIASVFERLGFKEVARRAAHRPIMRYEF